ncbi:MAG: hypothetical protein Q8P95_05055, partial [bacterium]|nr:hypothetical protein [bacterium]
MRTLSPVAPDRIEGCETETITALRLRYRELCNRIVKTREGDSDERWRVFCEVSEVREQLLPLIKNDRAYLAFEPDTSRLENQLLTRALELSGGIRAHFEQKGKATQEDVLLQELFAVQDHLKSSYFANFLLRIELLRARDTAAALWRALEEQLKLDLDTSSRVLSVGAGLAQFEILVHNNTGARVQTIDLRHDIPDLAKSGAIEHLRGC